MRQVTPCQQGARASGIPQILLRVSNICSCSMFVPSAWLWVSCVPAPTNKELKSPPFLLAHPPLLALPECSFLQVSRGHITAVGDIFLENPHRPKASLYTTYSLSSLAEGNRCHQSQLIKAKESGYVLLPAAGPRVPWCSSVCCPADASPRSYSGFAL